MNNSIASPRVSARNSEPDPVSAPESEPAASEQWLKLAVLTVSIAALAGVVALIVWFAKLHPVGSILVCTTFLWALALWLLDLKD